METICSSAPDILQEAIPVVFPSGISSATIASTPTGGQNKGGRPRNKPLQSGHLTKAYKRATTLRPNRPLGLSLHEDFWIQLLANCRPELLFILRLLNTSFKEAISKVSVWKHSLINEFGQSLPDPPQGLSYMNYANLLTKHGCHACDEESKGKARRTYWAFQRRFCEECLGKQVLFVCVLDLQALEQADIIHRTEIYRARMKKPPCTTTLGE